jgi:hypothetical protein
MYTPNQKNIPINVNNNYVKKFIKKKSIDALDNTVKKVNSNSKEFIINNSHQNQSQSQHQQSYKKSDSKENINCKEEKFDNSNNNLTDKNEMKNTNNKDLNISVGTLNINLSQGDSNSNNLNKKKIDDRKLSILDVSSFPLIFENENRAEERDIKIKANGEKINTTDNINPTQTGRSSEQHLVMQGHSQNITATVLRNQEFDQKNGSNSKSNINKQFIDNLKDNVLKCLYLVCHSE